MADRRMVWIDLDHYSVDTYTIGTFSYQNGLCLWVIRTLSALGIKDFRSVLLGMYAALRHHQLTMLNSCNYVTNLALTRSS
jgi:hypothetical protein